MSLFVPETTAQAWVYAKLSGSSAVIAALGNNQIHPNIAPPEVTTRHISHWFYGPSGGKSAFPIGRGLVQIGMTSEAQHLSRGFHFFLWTRMRDDSGRSAFESGRDASLGSHRPEAVSLRKHDPAHQVGEDG